MFAAVNVVVIVIVIVIAIVVVVAIQKLIKFLVTNRPTSNFRLARQTPEIDLHKRRLVCQKEQQQQQQICILCNTHLVNRYKSYGERSTKHQRI